MSIFPGDTKKQRMVHLAWLAFVALLAIAALIWC